MTNPRYSSMSWMRKLGRALSGEAEDREDLVQQMRQALERGLIDSDALQMMEGVLGVADLQVRDIMIPRSQMDVIDIRDSPAQFIPSVMQTARRMPASMASRMASAANGGGT